MNVSPPDYHLIARELAGIATPDESARLQAWMAEDPEHQRVWTMLRRAWALSSAPSGASVYDADVDWPKVLARIERRQMRLDRTRTASTRVDRSLRRPAWTRHVGLRAAVVAAVLLAPFIAWRLAHRPLRAVAMTEISTPRGGTREAVLPDGSRVHLGAESSIRYAAGFVGATRTIELRGMAFFDVVHDPAHPFLVRTRNGVTARDVGTRFVVDAYPEHSRVEVAVAQGRVALSGGSPAAGEVAIGAGEVGEVGASGVPAVGRDDTPDAHFAWMRGRLVIHDRPLTDALVELGRWYDVQLKVEDPALAARRISTTAGDRPIADVLAKIALALGAHGEQRGDTTVIVP